MRCCTRTWGVLGESVPACRVHKESTEAANGWRIMARHVYDMRRANRKVGIQAVQDLIGMVQLPAPRMPRCDDAELIDDSDEAESSCHHDNPEQEETCRGCFERNIKA